MTHLIGYARVSMAEQNPRLQIDALVGFGVAEEDIHTDIMSGGKTGRPGLLAAKKHLRAGDTLVVWKLDRLARSLRDLIDIVAFIRERQAHLRVLTEPIDTSTPGGTLIFHMFGAIAEFERALIRERTMAGLAAARARGRVGGRKPKATPEQKAEALRLIAEGETVRQAAKRAGVTTAAIYKWKEQANGL